MKQGGIFITSGIIDMKEAGSQGGAVKANGAFEIVETTHQGEWVSMTARENKSSSMYHFFVEPQQIGDGESVITGHGCEPYPQCSADEAGRGDPDQQP